MFALSNTFCILQIYFIYLCIFHTACLSKCVFLKPVDGQSLQNSTTDQLGIQHLAQGHFSRTDGRQHGGLNLCPPVEGHLPYWLCHPCVSDISVERKCRCFTNCNTAVPLSVCMYVCAHARSLAASGSVLGILGLLSRINQRAEDSTPD